jgi:hypothetical protein
VLAGARLVARHRALGAVAIATVLACAGACGLDQPRRVCDLGGAIGTVCGFHNPEDVEHVERAGLVLVTNMHGWGGDPLGGFVAAYHPDSAEMFRLWPAPPAVAGGDDDPDPALGDPACTSPPDAETFRPHGLTARSGRDRTLVFVAAHAGAGRGREAVEVFELEGRGRAARLRWKACIPTPGAVQANDVAVTRDGEVFVSNYQPDASVVHLIKASVLGARTGDLLAWRADRGWRHVDGTTAALANGVAVSGDGSTLFYTESATGMIHRVPRNGGGGAISVELTGNPDNLSWTRRGTLLVATHTAGSAFALCLFGWLQPCTTGWAVLEVDPATLAVKRVLEHDGDVLGAVSSAAQVGDTLVLGSVFDDRIGVVRVHAGTRRAARSG